MAKVSHGRVNGPCHPEAGRKPPKEKAFAWQGQRPLPPPAPVESRPIARQRRPKRPPRTPRTISRPTDEPIERATLLPMASTIESVRPRPA